MGSSLSYCGYCPFELAELCRQVLNLILGSGTIYIICRFCLSGLESSMVWVGALGGLTRSMRAASLPRALSSYLTVLCRWRILMTTSRRVFS